MAFTAISSSMPSSAFVRSILSSQCISTPTTPSQKSSSLSWASSFPSISLSRGSPFVSSNPAHAKVLFIQSAWTRRSRGEAAKRPNKKSWKQRTDMYMRPFLLNVFFSKKFMHAKVMHRGTSKVISVATTNAKDLRNSLPSLTDHNACRVIGKLIAERSKEADVYAMSYEPRKDERIEVWTTGFEGPTKDEGKGKGNGSSWCRTFHSPARTFRTWPVYASQPPNNRQRPPPGVDTRIHWQNDEEGWIGGPTPSQSRRDQKEQNNNALGPSFADLLNNSSDSHYQFLGVGAEADLEEIKSAYRRLSKEYHPDTTSLPLKAASDKFMKLKQVYEVLSNEESRKFYDWTLAQEEASRQADKLRIKLEDPYEQELQNWKSTPDMVDRLAGRNMDLSDQATTALTLDILIILFAIGCIVYVLLFKEPYY